MEAIISPSSEMDRSDELCRYGCGVIVMGIGRRGGAQGSLRPARLSTEAPAKGRPFRRLWNDRWRAGVDHSIDVAQFAGRQAPHTRHQTAQEEYHDG